MNEGLGTRFLSFSKSVLSLGPAAGLSCGNLRAVGSGGCRAGSAPSGSPLTDHLTAVSDHNSLRPSPTFFSQQTTSQE